MAFVHDKDFTVAATGTQNAVVPAGGIAADSVVVVHTNNRNSAPSRVADSRGNGYYQVVGVNGAGGNKFVTTWLSVLTNALLAADTITCTYGSGFGEAIVSSFTGTVGASTRDTGVAQQSSATALTVSGVRPSMVDDLVVACWSNIIGAVVFTKGASYTLGGDISNSSSQLSSEWKTATVDGTQTADATYGAATVSAANLATFAQFFPSPPVLDVPVVYLRQNV